MSSEAARALYADIGVRPVINCSSGNLTVLGGSILSPTVTQAMQNANRYYADMRELLEKSGHAVAEIVGAEDALVTSGCTAAMVLGVAALMAGTDRERAARLPDTSGMKRQIIIQKLQRYKYERALTIPGAELVEVGGEEGTEPADIEAAIGPDTLALHFVASRKREGVVPFGELLLIGRKHHVPVIVDAAGQVWPVENLRKYPEMGADLAAHSSKYFGGPNSAGFLAGRQDLIDAAMMHSFIGFEYGPPRTIGRGMKLDRQEIFGMLVALREWVGMDHDARFAEYARRAESLQVALAGIPHIQTALHGEPVMGVRVTFDPSAIRKTSSQIRDELKAGNPSLWFGSDYGLSRQRQEPHSMVFAVKDLMDGDEKYVAERLGAVLADE